MSTTPLPAADLLKQHAKRLRAGLAEDGDFISHSESLELIAKQYGFRDWNTLFAAMGNGPPPMRFQLGGRVKGRYLGQAFTGEIIGLKSLPQERMRLQIEFDEPVDVVTFDSFSAFRKRVSALIKHDGFTVEKLSNGEPHMFVEPLR